MRLRQSLVFFRLLFSVLSVIPAVVWVPVALAASNPAATGPRTGLWAHESSSLAPDPGVVWGQLENGLRYALLPHRGVPGRVSMQLVVLAGSIDETERERGLAHFTEHMVFRRTKNFSFEEKMRFFQQLGMDFGSDVNATTTYDHTAYTLEFHDVTAELLQEGMRVLRDFADGGVFDPAEIERERGVVLSEMRDVTDLASSNMDHTRPLVLKGTRYPERDPIGTAQSLRALQREDFVRFYERMYRADQMIVVAAGDLDPTALAGMLRERFGDMAKPATPPPTVDEGRLDMTRGLRAGVFSISAISGAGASVMCTTPLDNRSDSIDGRSENLRRRLAMQIVGERLQNALGGAAQDASYTVAFGHGIARLAAIISDDDWARDLGVLDDLVRFTAQRGFEKREIDQLRRVYQTQFDFYMSQRETVDPRLLAEQLAESILTHKVYLGFEAEQRYAQGVVSAVTPRELQAAFQSMWDLDRMVYHISGNVIIEGGPAEVVKKVQEGRKAGLRHFRSITRKESVFPANKWGTPAPVAGSREIPELHAKLLRLENNVRINYVPNRSAAGVVHVIARIGHGLLDMPDDRSALKDYGLRTLLSSGSAHFPPEQLELLINDHLSYFSFDLQDQDAFAFRAGATADKLDVALGLITDFLARPLFNTMNHREQKARAFMERSLNSGSQEEALRQMKNHLFKGDPRLTWGGPADYIRLSAVDVRNWLEQPLRRGYLEVTIVGDISEEDMLASVSRTLAQLSPRAEKKPALLAPRSVKVSARPGFERIEYVGEQHQGVVLGAWPVQEALDPLDKLALQVVARVLQDRVRMRLRSDLGLAYAPGAHLDLYNGFPEFSLVLAHVACDPDESTRIGGLLTAIGAELAAGGVTEEEFIGTRHLLRGQIRSAFREAGFLLNVMKRAQEKPASIDEAIALRNGLVANLAREEVNLWAGKVLARTNSRVTAIVPKPFIGIFQTQGQ